MVASLNSAREVAALGPILVGLTFVWAGGLKAVAPHVFRGHLGNLALIPHRLLSPSVAIIAGLEAALGTALIVGVARAFILPASIALLVALSVVSWWSVSSGRTSDCGCYGGVVRPSIVQSVGLNALFCLLIASGWLAGPGSSTGLKWQWLAVIVAFVATTTLTIVAQRFQETHGRLLFDTSPLKLGRRWRNGWAGGLTGGTAGEVLVAFLGPDCPYCAEWVKVGNAMSQSAELPHVIGVVGATQAKQSAFIKDNAIRFPVASISPSLLGRLAQAVPTTVLLQDGIIKKMWVGHMPPEFVDRVKQAFFPNAVGRPMDVSPSAKPAVSA